MSHRFGTVAILGRPNAGKSTLLNALLGTKLAIVAPKPQTTRTAIQGVLTSKEAQIVLVDTPGIHRSTTMLDKRMMNEIRTSTDADVILFLVDALAPFTEQDTHAVDLVKKIDAPAIAVLNKVDQLDSKPKLLELIDRYTRLHQFAAYLPISALKGEGLDALRKEVIARLPEGPALYPKDHLTAQSERFLAAELIREKILRLTRQEVPHSVTVMIDAWDDTARLVRIAATIYVERPGQKAILIGAGGSLMKKIGTQARHDIESLLGKKIFLETLVKVRPNWREDPEFLKMADL